MKEIIPSSHRININHDSEKTTKRLLEKSLSFNTKKARTDDEKISQRTHWRAPKSLKVAVFLIVEKRSLVWVSKPSKQAVKTKTSMAKSLRKASALASEIPEEDSIIPFLRWGVTVLGPTPNTDMHLYM